jgi:hypothetical protein
LRKIILVILLLIVGYLFLIYKVCDIFGFWRILLTNIGLFKSGVYLEKLISAKRFRENEILYNPRALPKYINIVLSIAIGYYLFIVLDLLESQVYSSDFIFGISYIVLSIGILTICAILNLIRE